MAIKAKILVSGALSVSVALGSVGGAQAQVLFWSNQAAPVEETQAMRDQVLAGFEGEVDFQAQDPGPFLTRLDAELEAGSGSIGLVGALHGELSSYADAWADLSEIDLGDITVSEAFLELARLGTDELKYLPWMQANYVMAASNEAVEYLPEGYDINALSYDEFIDWMRVLAEETGQPRFGFPAGPDGLKHRFFQGFLLPSYAGSTVTKFNSPEAIEGWEKFRELWQYTNPASTNYGFLQEPLLSGDVWVGFDHVARLADAFDQRPGDFVAFPAPAGPVGRGFMPVLAGIAIPANAPDMEQSMALATYMMQPETQVATLLATSFFPTTDAELPDDLPASAQALGAAITAMTSGEDALPALLPVGLGDLGGQFNQVYIDAFERIILGNQDIPMVLEEQASQLRAIIEQAGAPCWEPDEPSEGPCPVH